MGGRMEVGLMGGGREVGRRGCSGECSKRYMRGVVVEGVVERGVVVGEREERGCTNSSGTSLQLEASSRL